MNVGIVAGGEPLIIDPAVKRPFRCGMLADALVRGGHSVHWWTTQFDHVTKRNRHMTGPFHVIDPGYTLHFMAGPVYSRNVSLARIRHNRGVARDLARQLRRDCPDLDVVVVCVPTHELAKVSLQWAAHRGIPVILDVRDLWPDVYLRPVPEGLRSLVRTLLKREFDLAEMNFARATAITAVSQSYLDWALARAGRVATVGDAVFPIGFPGDVFSETSPTIPDSGPFVAVFAGIFGSTYDLETVVTAARIIERDGQRDIRFVLAGDGDQRSVLEQFAVGLSNIEFPGWVDSAQLCELLNRASVGLATYAPGAPQSLPNKPFEYWAAGLPVVSSLPGELRCIIETEQVGVHYEAGDARSMVRALYRLYDDRLAVHGASVRSKQLFRRSFSASEIYPAMAEHIVAIAEAHCGRA